MNKRRSKISCDKDSFNSVKLIYQDVQDASSYHHDLAFNRSQQPKKRKLQGHAIWFNPPYNRNVETNIVKSFLKLIDRHFPNSNQLHKIFNRNTFKTSYSCMKSVKTISNRNRSILQQAKPVKPKTSNCN